MGDTEYLTFLIAGMTAVISIRAFNNRQLLESYMFVPVKILRDKQYYRLFYSALIHADMTHLVFNMFCFISFGSILEKTFGPHILLLMYATSILGSGLLSLYFHRHHDYRALGASGGVSGIIFAYIFLQPGSSIAFLFLPVYIPSWLFAILFVLGSYYAMRSDKDNIAHDAHLGGAVAGLLTTAIFFPDSISRNLALFLSLVSIFSILMYYTIKRPLFLPNANPLTMAYWRSIKFALTRKHEEKTRIEDKENLDRLLSKISETGMESLTRTEKKKLNRIARKIKSKSDT